jgi:hypothetical protein
VSFSEEGKGGGVALFWDESVEVELFKINSRVIDVMVTDQEQGIKWRCTCVYGEPKTHLRHQMWDLLRKMRPMIKGPWLMLGDFNETMWQEKHFSRRRRGEKQMEDFRNMLSDCNLFDLGFSGLPWTYDNKQKGERNVRVRLDRAVACPDWSRIFPHSHVHHLVSSRSDHSPILVYLDKKPVMAASPRFRRYEMHWEKESTLSDEIQSSWQMQPKANNLGDIANKLNSVMGNLQSWSKRTTGHIPRKIEKLRIFLEKARSRRDNQSIKRSYEIAAELDEFLEKEEIFWKQRSRVSWLREGDRNTRYFHRKATWRAKKNNIRSLRKNDGSLTQNPEEMGTIASEFFLNLFTVDESVQPELAVEAMNKKVTDQMNADLCRDMTEEEITDTSPTYR